MRRALLTLLLLGLAVPAAATLVEAPPDDYLMIDPSVFGAVDPATADIVQSAVSANGVADRVILVWTMDLGTGPREVVGGVLDANASQGEILALLDDTEGFVRDPAVAYDENTGRWLAVWAQEAAPGAYEIYGRFMEPDGSTSPAPIRISNTGLTDSDPRFDALQPAVSSNDAGTFLVAWAADDDASGVVDGQFGIYHRTIDARSGALGPVTTLALPGTGLAALKPRLGYFRSTDQWIAIWDQDSDSNASSYAPYPAGNFVAGSAAVRLASEPVRLGAGGAQGTGRRASQAVRNSAIAIDRKNQRLAFVYEETLGGAAAARRIGVEFYTSALGFLAGVSLRDLDALGHGPSAYVRDPVITHSRISDSFVVAWRESLDAATGEGQTLYVAETELSAGIVTPPFTFVNQGPGGALPTEFGPPDLAGGWRSNGRTLAMWTSNASGSPTGYMQSWGQAFDLGAVTAAPPGLLPAEFAVRVAPNPFNPRTSVQLALPIAGRARVDIYDVRGRLVRQLVDEDLPAGNHSRTWSGMDDRGQRVASGVYMVKVSHPGGEQVTKVALVE
jgi:hypothetical protein